MFAILQDLTNHSGDPGVYRTVFCFGVEEIDSEDEMLLNTKSSPLSMILSVLSMSETEPNSGPVFTESGYENPIP